MGAWARSCPFMRTPSSSARPCCTCACLSTGFLPHVLTHHFPNARAASPRRCGLASAHSGGRGRSSCRPRPATEPKRRHLPSTASVRPRTPARARACVRASARGVLAAGRRDGRTHRRWSKRRRPGSVTCMQYSNRGNWVLNPDCWRSKRMRRSVRSAPAKKDETGGATTHARARARAPPRP